MSVAVLQSPFHLEKYGWPAPEETKDDPVMAVEDDHNRPGQFDIWSAIQAQKGASPVAADPPAPYVHPLMRRSSSSLSQMSLQMCTESLGSESGSDDFSSVPDGLDFDYSPKNETKTEEEDHDVHEKVAVVEERGGLWSRTETEERQVPQRKADELVSVNYNCSISRRSPSRSFPPPLPSLSRRDGPCFHMRPHRRDGRLVVQAVLVPSRNYLHAQREGGRLLLSFVDATFDDDSSETVEIEQPHEHHQVIDEIEENKAEEVKLKNCYEADDDEEEEEEEVEVVDRGTVIEVKVSTQPQQQNGSAMKILRSSLVINKFVGGTPRSSNAKCEQSNLDSISRWQAITPATVARRPPPTPATAAAAVVVASTLSASTEAYNDVGARPSLGDDEHHLPLDNKLLFTSKRRNREELLHSMKRGLNPELLSWSQPRLFEVNCYVVFNVSIRPLLFRGSDT
ncbi:unnamed protein product [Musa acuminata subsp. burmannicoides]